MDDLSHPTFVTRQGTHDAWADGRHLRAMTLRENGCHDVAAEGWTRLAQVSCLLVYVQTCTVGRKPSF